MINAKTQMYSIIGNPVSHSLSPQMHNSAFLHLKLNKVFLAFKIDDIKKGISALKEIGCRGIVVTVPFKEKVMDLLDFTDTAAGKIGAVNAIKVDNGKLTGTNTDWIGAVKSLEEYTDLSAKKVAVLGAGGAARAVIYGLKEKGAEVSIFNRTVSIAENLAEHFKLKNAYPLSEMSRIKEYEIIVNTTSVGMHPDEGSSLLPENIISKNQTVFDIVYTPHWTRLLKTARQKKAKTVFGYKMVLYGGTEIFRFFTGKNAPEKVMEKTLLKHLK